MDQAHLETELLNYIRQNLVPDEAVHADTPLISSSLIDSMGLVSLTLYIEKLTGKKIPSTDVRPENWDSLNQIVDYLKKQGSQ